MPRRYLQHSLLDEHLLRICFIKTLPRKKPMEKKKKKKPMAKEKEYSILESSLVFLGLPH
jgi:hypothetical protein